ncbi:MAG: YbhB/YbcL family Raf kinase inhibitor-like protein [Pseudomonadota bacterium]|nr:YbhB/YbcL family Raf kinase inhibitor-like protein [Pseudomonadota bacterium]MDE3037678.1 YbhB/YbcL family Raf kinase inhibitor-like protein [Pseudomonadota bacterium]
MLAVNPAPLSVTLGGIENGKPINPKFAYCMQDGAGKTRNGGNINPAISWSGAPAGAKSYAVIAVDPDVPANFEPANKEGRTIAADFPRRDFYHWVLVDIPPTITRIDEGQDSKGTATKPTGKLAYGVSGHNDYGVSEGGYNGPCPPWNDARLHHYHFRVYALDVPSLNLPAAFGGREAESAMQGHILAQGETVGTYTNNPAVK